MKNKFEIRGNVVVIFLKCKGGVMGETIIDIGDLDRVQEFRGNWFGHWSPGTRSFYARGVTPSGDGKQKTILLHRWVMDTPAGLQVDHRSHDTLDNTRCNLTNVTPNVNQQNRSGSQVNSISGIRGVYWHKASKKWLSKICVDGKCIHIGCYANVQDAANAAHNARVRLMPGYVY